MANDEILLTDELRLRLINIEYKNLDNKKFESEVKRIYFEETGKKLPCDVQVKKWDEIKDVSKSGYNGTVIHFYSDEKEINQAYVISQGSHDSEDWEYNFAGLFLGLQGSQYISTKTVVDGVKKEFAKNTELKIIGLSHSLAHNNNANVELINSDFYKVYSVNGAPPNYYQLFNIDDSFRMALSNEYYSLVQDPDNIYDIPPAELKSFAENYYKEQGKNIYQLISYDDPLFGISGTRGFFNAGTTEFVDTNKKHEGIRKLTEHLPDNEVAKIQAFFLNYSNEYKSGGLNKAVLAMTGIDIEAIEKHGAKIYLKDNEKVSKMIDQLDKKLPVLMDQIKYVNKHSETIFGALVAEGYMTDAQKKAVVKDLNGLMKDLDEIHSIIGSADDARDIQKMLIAQGNYSPGIVLGSDFANLFKLLEVLEKVKKRTKNLNENLAGPLSVIVASHGIEEMLNALNTDKSYAGNDMILKGQSGGQSIKVNISKAVRTYQKGLSLLDEKEDVLSRFYAHYTMQLPDDAIERKRKVLDKIHDMEANPYSYSHLLNGTGTVSKAVVGIKVSESFTPVALPSAGELAHPIKEQISKNRDLLKKMRTGIEDLFEKDEYIAALFDFK